MKVFDQNDNLVDPAVLNMGLGKIISEMRVSKHHDAVPRVEAVEEVGHYEVVKEYPNGGKDIEWVIDTPGIPGSDAIDAWDEYEEIKRFIPYEGDKLKEMIRKKRDALLEQTDWTQVLDAPIDTSTRNAYRKYRQMLRDLPAQDGFPDEITWPELPAIVKAMPDPVDDAVDALIGGI